MRWPPGVPTHLWYWNPRMPGEKRRKGMRCWVLVRGGRNSVMVRMEDGEIVVTSRNAVRKIREQENK